MATAQVWLRRVLVLALLIAILAAGGSVLQVARADAAVFFNEIHYDNDGTDAGEAIEIAGPAGTDLSGWSIVLYNGNGGAAYDTRNLSGVIPDQQNGFGVLSFSYPVNGIQNGSPDGMALVDASSAVVQFLSYEGSFTAVGGPADGLVSTDIGVSEASNTTLGFSLQLTGTGSSYDTFTWAGAAANTFGAINTGQSFGVVTNQPVSIACGQALSVFEGNTASQAISASDADGVVTSIVIDSIVPDVPMGSVSLTDFVPAGAAGETATANLAVGMGIPAGSYTVTLVASNDDAEPQTASCSLGLTITEVLPIGTVQGIVSDSDDGLAHRSSYAPASGTGSGQTVVIQGVIYQKTLGRNGSTGANLNGFFIQNTAETADGDPNSSDGIFVFMSGFTDLIGGYVPQVGDEIIMSGRVSEFFNLTQLSSGRMLQVVRTGVDLSAEVPATEANPPSDLADANRYWERLEGMRIQVPAGSIALNGRDVFSGSEDSEIWVARPDSEIAMRLDEYSRRSFRDAHPLDDNSADLFDNGNGYRILLGTLGVKAAAGDNTVLLNPARTFATLQNSPVGGLYFSFNKFQVSVEQQPEWALGADPSANAAPTPADLGTEFSVSTYNVENLYDFRDDPTDGCDFVGNSGCPGVNPPFNYVPASEADYLDHLSKIAHQIVFDIHSPDIVLAQEAEDQDICIIDAGALVCDTMLGALSDGKPDTLQELTLAILAAGGPAYDAAYDRNGADDRGIVSAYLFRTDRVELLPASADHPVLGSTPTVDYRGDALAFNSDVQNPKALNADLPADVDTSTGVDGSNVFTRAPQVALFRVWRNGIGLSTWTDLYVVNNHFSSTPDGRVGQRTEQAGYNAAIVDAIQGMDSEALVIVGGDLNVFPRPDDPFAPGHPLFPSDQLAPLYEQGMLNLFDVLVAEVPSSAYSYVFQGQAQTLDHLFVSPSLMDELVQVRAAHINADFSGDLPGEEGRGASDHDPQVARFHNVPSLDDLQMLLDYLHEQGEFTGAKTFDILSSRLDKAQLFMAAGRLNAVRGQIEAFLRQVDAYTPHFVTPDAAEALTEEASLFLLLLPAHN